MNKRLQILEPLTEKGVHVKVSQLDEHMKLAQKVTNIGQKGNVVYQIPMVDDRDLENKIS
jgi:hypothetical protein